MSDATPFSQRSGMRVGEVSFLPVAAQTGTTLPVAFGTVPWVFSGALGLSVIVKASFTLPGWELRSPEPIHFEDVLDASGSHLVAPSDLVPRRLEVDVLACGRASVASGRPSPTTTTRLAILHGDDLALDLVYTVAAGSPGGFEGVPSHAASRAALLRGISLAPAADGVMHLPADFEWDYFQASHPHQRLPELRPDARIFLEGLHPTHATIDATLPGVRVLGAAFGHDARAPQEPSALQFRLDTLVLDAERLVGTLVWRAELGLRDVTHMRRLTIAAGLATHAHPLTLPAALPASRPPPSAVAASRPGEQTAGPSPVGAETAFVPSSGAGTATPFGAGPAPGRSAARTWMESLGATTASGPTPAGDSLGPPSTGGSAFDSETVALPRDERIGTGTAASFNGDSRRPDETAPLVPSQAAPLPFTSKPGAPPPSAAAWAELTSGSSSGETVAVSGYLRPGKTLPFDRETQPAFDRDAAPVAPASGAEPRASLADDQAEERRRQREQARRATAEKATTDAELEEAASLERAEEARKLHEAAELRRADEKRRFEEQEAQRLALEAKRKDEAKERERQSAADLEASLYGTFVGDRGKR